MSRMKAKAIEDEILDGVGKVLRGKELSEDTVFAAFELLSKNVARLVMFENMQDQVQDLVTNEIDSQRVKSMVIATTDDLYCGKAEVNTIAAQVVDEKVAADNFCDKKEAKAIAIKVIDEHVATSLDDKVNEVFKDASGPVQLAMAGIEADLKANIATELSTKISTAVGGEFAEDAKNLLQSTIEAELEKTKNSAIISINEDSDLNPKKLGEMLIKSMNAARSTIPDCNSGKDFEKKAITFVKLAAPREGKNKDKKFWKISLRGKLSKRALFSSFAREGQDSLRGLSVQNEIPQFLKRDFRTAEHLGSVLRRKYPGLKSRSSVNSKSAQIELMLAKKNSKGSRFVTICSSKASDQHKHSLRDFYDISKKDDKIFEKLYALCESIENENDD